MAFACVDFAAAAEDDDAATDELLDGWFAADDAQRAAWVRESPLAARHLGVFDNTHRLMYFSARHGNMRCLRWGLRQGFCAKNVTAVCATNGHLACLQYAREHGCPWDIRTCGSAALQGHLACLAYAHEHGCPWDVSTCVDATLNGHLACLQYAHEHGCPWDQGTCSNAALNGHLDCLAYAHEHGCPWNDYVCVNAAMLGHLACLRYAHERGCDWDKCKYVMVHGHADCVAYMSEHPLS